MKKSILCLLTIAGAIYAAAFLNVKPAAANEEISFARIAGDPVPTPADPVWTAQLLAEHNALRQKYNVPPLVWDNTVASSAQAWAERIALSGLTPPEHRDSETIGENIVWGQAGAFDPQFLVDRWGREVSKYDLATNKCTPENACLHFTQVVWSKTTKLGCGKATTSDGKTDFVVCDYSPTGNIRGQVPFSPVTSTTAQVKPSPSSTPTTGDVYLTGNPQITNFPVVPRRTPTPNTECDVCNAVQKLAAQVEQLKPTEGKSTPKNNGSATKTTLLFPFVTNQAGFETGISIANTSADTLGTKPSAGNCELSYFGGTTGGGAAPRNQSTTYALLGGQTLVFTLSSGGSNGIAATPGFQGYIMVTCNFPYARGYAFISDVGAQKLANGYLAEVVTDPRQP